MASEFVSFVILFSLGISMVVAVGVTVTNLENGVADSAARNELADIFKDVKNRLIKELEEISWQTSSNSFYSYTFQFELPTLLARRFSFIIGTENDTSGNYFLIASANFIDNNIDISEPLGLNSGNFFISGSFNSIFNIHRVTIEKTGSNSVFISFSSNNR
jgi:hypothetical protein